MGNSDNKTFFYALAATFVVLFALAMSVGGGSNSPSLVAKLFGIKKAEKTTLAYQKLIIPQNKYSVTRFKTGNNGERESIYNNDYQAQATHANSYVEPNEVNHPLIASAKFVGKKIDVKNVRRKLKRWRKTKEEKSNSESTYDDDEFFEEDSIPASSNTANHAMAGGGL